VSVNISTAEGNKSLRLGFTDQRLTAYGWMIVWSQLLQKKRVREQLQRVLPQAPTSPNAYDTTDIGLGFLGGVLCGADKLSRVAWLAQDAAVAEVLGIEAVPSQSTLTRFFDAFSQQVNERLNALNHWVAGAWPSAGRDGYTLDVDSWCLVARGWHQEGVEVEYTRLGLKPCHRPLVGVLAEQKVVVHYWLRRGDSACVKQRGGIYRSVPGSTARTPACRPDARRLWFLCRHGESSGALARGALHPRGTSGSKAPNSLPP
jgi:hypothetical protein